MTRRENNYDIATLTALDKTRSLYDGGIQKFDTVKIELKADAADSYTTVFGGRVRQVNPSLQNNKILTVNCKGHGAALEDTHCNRDYGQESSHPDWDYPDEILQNLITDMVNKSFGDSATGYALNNTYVSDFCDTQIKYINNPYRANIEVVDLVATMTSAIGGGTTAGGHWIVDPDSYFLFGQIGDHTAESATGAPVSKWPDWWNTDQAESTLEEGVDFRSYVALDKAEEYANNVVLITDFRRPAYDYITENGVTNGLWDKSGTTLTDGTTAPLPVVGSNYVYIEDALAWYPADESAGWDVTAWGSTKTIPRLNFYMYKNNLVEAGCQIRLFTTGNSTDYFYCTFSTLADPDEEWIFKSIPIGPYWASSDETRKDRWTASSANADWADINGVAFYVVDDGENPGYLCLDDLHFTGKIARSASHTASITAYKEYQKVLIARNSMDDSCAAADDTGFAGRIARAELLRRISNAKTVTFPTKLKPTMMAGQKAHLHTCKKSASTYALNTDVRILQVEHAINAQQAVSTVTATTDLINSLPINYPDAYAMWQENMFLNSAEAKNIRAGAEVDLLIPMLKKTY